ncbi:MAG: 30S ribosomal protein S5 [Puniceicoccales bacterium]|jgi:small subunit ribosomal protein S5|nr:30S ribosomal protein S5 [Puniceicoccales bacterium]
MNGDRNFSGFFGANSGFRGRRKRDSGEATKDPRDPENQFVDKVVRINRCAKVVKGGRRFGFSALAVVGDKAGRVGIGLGKAKETPDAVRKAIEQAKKNIKPYSIHSSTVPHVVVGVADGGRVLLRPAAPGTGIIAGGGVRAVLEVLGVTDILTKSMGSNNPFAMVRATLDALSQLRTKEEVMAIRNANCDC